MKQQLHQLRSEGVRRLHRSPGQGRLGAGLILCFGIPAFIVLASYLWLALDHGTPLLWNVVVHESGRYTLGQTVFYFSHFLREIPIAVGYALFLLGISARVGRGLPGDDRVPLVGWMVVVLAGVLVATALLASARSHGWTSAMQDLLQYRTRDDLAGYGTHARYHWLSTLWFGAAAGLAPVVAQWIVGAQVLRAYRFWTRLAWAYFLALTLVFGISTDIFLDARYAGHQAREILTHGSVTLPLAIGMLLAAGGGRASDPLASPASHRIGPWLPWIFTALVLLLPAYLGLVSLSGGVLQHGQAQLGLGAMVAAHYFEHTLDYMLVLLLVGGGLAFRKSQTSISYQE